MMRCALVAALVLAFASAVNAAKPPSAPAERKAADAARKRGNWAAALLHYENIFDSTVTDDAARAKLRARFMELRPKVAPNTNPAAAGVWKVRAYAFRALETQFKDKAGKEHRAKHRFRDDEIEAIRAAMKGFADEVSKNTFGNLRIEWDLVVIDEPLKEWHGWPDPGNCMPHFTDLREGQVDSIFVFAKSRRSDEKRDEATEDLEWGLWAGTFGVLPETKGATYIGFNSPGPPSGILQFHEWLHAAQWALEAHQAYPSGLMITSDCGGNCGFIDGKPCYAGPRPDPKEEWMPLYRHLAQMHATRRMWRELSIRARPNNVWIEQYCRKALVLGPFPIAEKSDYGLTTPFIPEATASPRAGEKAAGFVWREVTSFGRSLDLAKTLGSSGQELAYLAFIVRSGSEQRAQLRLGSDDGCAIWQNGERILYVPVERPAEADQNVIDVRLKNGDNLFLLKVSNTVGAWEAMCRFTTPEGSFLSDVEYAIPK